MNKEDVVQMMFNKFFDDNMKMAEAFGMDPEQIKLKFEESAPSIMYMMNNIYDMLLLERIIISNDS